MHTAISVALADDGNDARKRAHTPAAATAATASPTVDAAARAEDAKFTASPSADEDEDNCFICMDSAQPLLVGQICACSRPPHLPRNLDEPLDPRAVGALAAARVRNTACRTN
jgi:hypothetical protein